MLVVPLLVLLDVQTWRFLHRLQRRFQVTHRNWVRLNHLLLWTGFELVPLVHLAHLDAL
jgi:hypothetical protein